MYHIACEFKIQEISQLFCTAIDSSWNEPTI